ncbi:MAG: hypothetical protein M3Q97_05230, partial [Bacteroidota bacterium]|nr:hypothetical protein [Bacteroidota bacterium]
MNYDAEDSIIFDIPGKKVFLYGNAEITYQSIVLKADFISIDWTLNEICAEGLPDSLGEMAGMPVFKEAEDEFNAQRICYNFKSKK